MNLIGQTALAARGSVQTKFTKDVHFPGGFYFSEFD